MQSLAQEKSGQIAANASYLEEAGDCRQEMSAEQQLGSNLYRYLRLFQSSGVR